MSIIDLSNYLSQSDLGAGIHLLTATASHQGSGFQIKVVVDTIDGVTVDEIVGITRQLRADSGLAELAGTEDFRIEVTSPGIAAGLQKPWQYQRHIGRRLEIGMRPVGEDDTAPQVVEGALIEAGPDGIYLETDGKQRSIAWEQIDAAKVILSW